MRDTYFEYDDTLRAADLPANGRPEMDYRPRPEPGRCLRTVYLLLACAVLAIPLTLAARIYGTYLPLMLLAGFALLWIANFDVAAFVVFLAWVFLILAVFFLPHVDDPLPWIERVHGALLVLLGLLISVTVYFRRGSAALAVCCASLGLVFWLLGNLVTHNDSLRYLYLVPLGLAVAALLLLSDAVSAHYISYLCANPRSSETLRQIWRSLGTFWHRVRSPAVATGFLVVLLIFALGFAALVVFSTRTEIVPLAGVWTVLFLLSASLVGAIFSCVRSSRAVHVYVEALSHWLTYAPHPTAPGVVRSPMLLLQRQFAVAVVLPLLSAAVLPLAFYFPVVANQQDWNRFAATDADRLKDFASLPGCDVAAPTLQDQTTKPTSQTAIEFLSPTYRRFADTTGQSDEAQSRQRSRALTAAFLEERWKYVQTLLSHSPEAWLPLACQGVALGEPIFIWSLLVSLVLSALVPVALFVTISFVAIAPLLSMADEELQDSDDSFSSDWEGYVHRVQHSQDFVERVFGDNNPSA